MNENVSAAYVKAQAQIGAAIKDAKNPHLRNTYADLGSVIEAIKPHLSEQDLGFVQEVTERPSGGVYVETVIIHASGETIRCGKLPMPASPGKGTSDAQAYGSAITYAKRYSLLAAFGVPTEDDDGNGAGRRNEDEGGTVGRTPPQRPPAPAPAAPSPQQRAAAVAQMLAPPPVQQEGEEEPAGMFDVGAYLQTQHATLPTLRDPALVMNLVTTVEEHIAKRVPAGIAELTHDDIEDFKKAARARYRALISPKGAGPRP